MRAYIDCTSQIKEFMVFGKWGKCYDAAGECLVLTTHRVAMVFDSGCFRFSENDQTIASYLLLFAHCLYTIHCVLARVMGI